MNSQLPTRIHVIGICGVATSALAIAFHKQGVIVTGSDKGFFPPVSTELDKQGVSYYAGWHPEKMIAAGVPDVVIVGTASGTGNPETVYAETHKIPIYSFAQAIGRYFTREHAIVCAGTWGKTSSTALLSYILITAGIDPSYMFGGVSLSHESSAKLAQSPWSVFEGDEYKSSPTDKTAKFFYYKPTHLLLTSVSWDHADLYPTSDEYYAVFSKLLTTLPPSGFVTACADQPSVVEILKKYPGNIIWYGHQKNSTQIKLDFAFSEVTENASGLNFIISHDDKQLPIHSPLMGEYQAENITGCFALAYTLGIPAEKIIGAISAFKGLHRRMEKRLIGKITIVDDIAHSPEKARFVLNSLQNVYKGKIFAVFEPNIGARERGLNVKYDNAFKAADIVIVPRLTTLKTRSSGIESPMDGRELTQTIAKSHPNVKYIENDPELIKFLQDNVQLGDVIAFLGSHGFRGMIEETVQIFS